MANFKRSLPSFDRCDRPSDAVGRLEIEYPGCFLHGPDENSGLAGCIFVIIMWYDNMCMCVLVDVQCGS